MMTNKPLMNSGVIAINLSKKWAIDDDGQIYIIEAFLDKNGLETTDLREAVKGIIVSSGKREMIELDGKWWGDSSALIWTR